MQEHPKEVVMKADYRQRAARKTSYTVVMRSRDDQPLCVRDHLDAQFLELADEFIMNARAIQDDPSRKRPRLRVS